MTEAHGDARATSSSTLALAPRLLAAAASGRPQAAAQQPVFPAETELVTVDVVVDATRPASPCLDLHARGLHASARTASPQEIASFEAVHRPGAAARSADADAAGRPRRAARVSSNRRRRARAGELRDRLRRAAPRPRGGRARARGGGRLPGRGVADGDRVALVGTAEGTRWTARMPEGREALARCSRASRRRRVGETRARRHDRLRGHAHRPGPRPDRDRPGDAALPRHGRDPARREPRPATAAPTADEVDELAQPDAGARRPGVRARSHAQRADARRSSSARSRRSPQARGRKSLVLVSGGLVQDPRLAASAAWSSARRGARTRPSTSSTRAGSWPRRAGLQAEVEPARRHHRPQHGRVARRDARRERGQRGPGRSTPAASVLENRNDLGGGLARIGRGVAQLLPARLRADEPRGGRALPQDRGEAGARGRESCARGAATSRPGRDDSAEGARGRATRPSSARSTRRSTCPSVPLRALAQVFGEAEPGQGRGARHGRGRHPRPRVRRAGGSGARHARVPAARGAPRHRRVTRASTSSSRWPSSRRRARATSATWFPITRELTLAPGPYQAKIVARDRNSGRVGSLTHEFEVPASAGLRVSSLVLSDRLRDEDGAGAGGARAHGAPARSRAAGLLHCRFEVYGAARDPATGQPNVTAGFAIRRSDGRVLAAAPETPLRPGPDGTLARSLGAPLDGAPPGRYEVIVLVTDLAAGQAAEAREPILIEAPARALTAPSGPAEVARASRRRRAGSGRGAATRGTPRPPPRARPSCEARQAEPVQRHRASAVRRRARARRRERPRPGGRSRRRAPAR